MELWKDIPGYEGIYEASTNGRIRTKKSKTTYTEKHGVRTWKSRILKGRGNNKQTGARVSLWKDGKYKDHLVARLIAYTFLGIPDKKLTVNHNVITSYSIHYTKLYETILYLPCLRRR